MRSFIDEFKLLSVFKSMLLAVCVFASLYGAYVVMLSYMNDSAKAIAITSALALMVAYFFLLNYWIGIVYFKNTKNHKQEMNIINRLYEKYGNDL